MVAGIDVTKYPDHVVTEMANVLATQDLLKYHELRATVASNLKDPEVANESLQRYADIMFGQSEVRLSKEERLKKEASELSNWMLAIDVSAIPKHEIHRGRFRI